MKLAEIEKKYNQDLKYIQDTNPYKSFFQKQREILREYSKNGLQKRDVN